MSKWIASGALTSRRLTEIYLERIANLNPMLNCFATVTADLALAEADAMDALTAKGRNLGPLHGIPYGLKDLFENDMCCPQCKSRSNQDSSCFSQSTDKLAIS